MSLSPKEAVRLRMRRGNGGGMRRGGSDGNGGSDGSSFDENHPAPAALY